MSCVIPEAVLACIREGAESRLPDIGTVQEQTLESDGRGGHDVTWSTLGTLACRVSRLKEPVEVVNANKVTVIAGYKLWFPADTALDLSGEKRIVVRGTTYEIIHADIQSSEQILGVLFANLIQ
jgi:hypothetical protein